VGYNQPPHVGYTLGLPNGQRLYHDDFSNGLKDWVVESSSDSTRIRVEDKRLDVVAPKGLTLWYKRPLEGDVRISFEALLVDEGGSYDRVSDLNCFWMAQDPAHPEDFFARTAWRAGVFGRYYSLNMYYVGYGGNHNSTTRFRRYNGDFEAFQQEGKRPEIIQEYTDSAHLIRPNTWHRVEICMEGNRVSYWMNGQRVFDCMDEVPYKKGYFGIRTTQNHMKIRNFGVYYD
jgi:rhamnogalacturonan endolyase